MRYFSYPYFDKVPKLTFKLLGEDSLSRIGSILKIHMYADECTNKGLRVSFARVLINLDVIQDIPREVIVEDPNGNNFKQKVVVDWLPPFYKKYQMIVHNCNVKNTTHGPTKVTHKWVPKKGPKVGKNIDVVVQGISS